MRILLSLLVLGLALQAVLTAGSEKLAQKKLRALYKRFMSKRSEPINDSGQQSILDAHNNLRRGVNPTPKDMQQMYWDDKMATIAQRHADTCPSGHDSNDQRRVEGYGINIGQNIAWGYNDWPAAVQGWYDEVKDFTYGYGKTGHGVVGHFTQVVNHRAVRVGCGFNDCSNNKTYVCNYAYGQTPTDVKKPYASGPSCADCPNTCNNKLCDCQGKLCLNGGTLDVATCTCKCTALYQDVTCNVLNCPASDPGYCGQPQPNGYPSTFCTIYNNVPTECPYMCSKCGSDQGNSNQGSSNDNGNCLVGDQAHCGTQWPASYCDKYSNVPDDCPHMCGKCSGSSSGSNQGNFACPARDPAICGIIWPTSYCSAFPNVPATCPYMCGKCEGDEAPPSCNPDKNHCQWWPTTFCTVYANVLGDCPYKCGLC